LIKVFILLIATLSCGKQEKQGAFNQMDENGLKQGNFIYYYDNDWNILSDSINASYYRLVRYSKDKPVGKIRDFHIDGRLQMEADSIVREDPETYHGLVQYFTDSGRVHLVEYYNDGELDTLKTVALFEDVLIKHKDEIPGSLDLAQTANDLAYLYREQKKYIMASELYEQAWKIRKAELGEESLLYANSSAKLGWVYIQLGSYTEAENLFLASMQVYKDSLGVESDRYNVSKNHLNWIYESTGRDKLLE